MGNLQVRSRLGSGWWAGLLSAVRLAQLAAHEPPADPGTQRHTPADAVLHQPAGAGAFEANATGDWGGWRRRLDDHGVRLTFESISEALANVAGGMRRDGTGATLALMGLDLDLERATGWWPGGSLRISGYGYGHLRSISGDIVGDLNGVSNIEAPPGWRWFELWLHQDVAGGALGLTLGNLAVDSDFAVTDYGAIFLNGGFGWTQYIPQAPGQNPPAYPFAGPGARLQAALAEGLELQVGIYDGDALDGGGRLDGLGWELNGQSGWLAAAQLAWSWRQGEGHANVGVMVAHADFPDLSGNGTVHRHSTVGYLALEQRLWADPGDPPEAGLAAFTRFGVGPADRQAGRLGVDAGLHWRGFFPGRPDDVAALGVVHLGLSRLLAGSLPAGLAPEAETAVEFTYRWQWRPWAYVQPDLQWILHPGGSVSVDDALVLGVRVGVSF